MLRWLYTYILVLSSVVTLSGCASFDQLISAKKPETGDDAQVVERIRHLAARWEFEPIPVGLTRQVFYDDAVISSRSGGLVRAQGRVKKLNGAEPIIVEDQPWETKHGGWGVGIYFSVLTNKEGAFQCWYMYGKNNRVGYAVSTNGLEWVKPRLGLGFDNEVMYPAHGPCVMIDKHDPRENHRYKMIYGSRGQYRTHRGHGVFFAHSPDGISWSSYDELEPLDDCGSDTANNMMWDEEAGVYRVFVRPNLGDRRSRQMGRPFIDSGLLKKLGAIFFVPTDIEPWIHIIDWNNDQCGQIYSLFAQKYGSIYIAYINAFRTGRIYGRGLTPDDKIDSDINEFYIATSRDGIHWDTTWLNPQNPFIPRGPPGSFDQNATWPVSSPLINAGDKHWIYYCGRWPRHSGAVPERKTKPEGFIFKPPKPRSAIGLVEIRMDGLIYLHNKAGCGVVETKSFIFEGNRLEVNADALIADDRSENLKRKDKPLELGKSGDQAGVKPGLYIEVLDKRGKAIPGYSLDDADVIKSDNVHHQVSWNAESDLTPLKGQEVRLRFVMEGAVRLYAFQVQNDSGSGDLRGHDSYEKQ